MAIDINIGALCLVRQNGSFFGPTVWVARAPDGDGHWSLLRKTAGGRSKREGRSSVGCGDLIVIKAAPAYQAGDVVWHKACVTSASPTAAISASSSPCRKTRCRCAAADSTFACRPAILLQFGFGA